jgi:hypothetical protein
MGHTKGFFFYCYRPQRLKNVNADKTSIYLRTDKSVYILWAREKKIQNYKNHKKNYFKL